jgi:protein arginine N-methyltransferase 3
MSNTVKFNLNLEGTITPEEANLSADDQIDSSDDDDDQNWDDWNSDSVPQSCKSLFEDRTLPSVKDVLQYDKDTYGFDLYGTYKKLGA